jgi:hypothetical protein
VIEKNGKDSGSLNQIQNLQSLLPAAVLIVLFLPGFWLTYINARETIQDSKPEDLYSEAATWLAENTREGSRIFQTDWDDFTRLFYYNTHNTYLVGLDPTYLSLYNGRLYEEWVDITQGEIEDPSEAIAGKFGGEYVFSDLDHEEFIDRADNDQGMSKVYEDEEAVIYQISP